MATPSMLQIPMQGMQCDPQRLAAAVLARLQPSVGQPQLQPQPLAKARILDRGAFATLYLLSAPLPRVSKSVVVRVSTRPVYNTVARKQEKEKIRGYVGILLLIHGTSLILAHTPCQLLPFISLCTADSSPSEQPARPLLSAHSRRAFSLMTPLRHANSAMGGSP